MSNYRLPKLFDRNSDLSKRWYVGYFFKHPENGEFKLFQIWISTKYKTKQARYKEADKIILSWSNKLKAGFNPYSDQSIKVLSISESLDFVLNLKKRTTKTRTFQTYKSFIKLFKKWLDLSGNNRLPLDSFNKLHAQDYFDNLIKSSEISGRTYNNILTGMRTLFNDLLVREHILRNPFLQVKPLPQIDPDIVAYSPDELKKMQNQISKTNPGLWLFCEFVFYCGIRPAELVRIRIEDIDLLNGKLKIQASNSKNNKTQIVNFPIPLIEDIKKMDISVYPSNYFLFSKNGLPGSIPISPVRYSEMFRKEADLIGLPKKKKLYDLKHTGAGIVIENGANINDVRLHLRHSDLNITHQYINRFKSSVGKDFLEKFPDLSKI